MHRAPAVSYPVQRSRLQLYGIVTLSLLAVSGCLAFHAQGGAWSWRLLGLVAATAAAIGFASWEWLHSVTGTLRWDGNLWYWEAGSGEVPCSVQLGLDMQFALVLRLSLSGGASGYWWVEAATASGRWLAMRRAVASSALHPRASTLEEGDARAGVRA